MLVLECALLAPRPKEILRRKRKKSPKTGGLEKKRGDAEQLDSTRRLEATEEVEDKDGGSEEESREATEEDAVSSTPRLASKKAAREEEEEEDPLSRCEGFDVRWEFSRADVVWLATRLVAWRAQLGTRDVKAVERRSSL